jgi:hypothetical protein
MYVGVLTGYKTMRGRLDTGEASKEKGGEGSGGRKKNNAPKVSRCMNSFKRGHAPVMHVKLRSPEYDGAGLCSTPDRGVPGGEWSGSSTPPGRCWKQRTTRCIAVTDVHNGRNNGWIMI